MAYFFDISRALSFELNLFLDRSFPLMFQDGRQQNKIIWHHASTKFSYCVECIEQFEDDNEVCSKKYINALDLS